MRFLVPVVFLSLLAASCHSSRFAIDSAPPTSNFANASAPADAAVSSAAGQADKDAPALKTNETEDFRPNAKGSEVSRMEIAETK